MNGSEFGAAMTSITNKITRLIDTELLRHVTESYHASFIKFSSTQSKNDEMRFTTTRHYNKSTNINAWISNRQKLIRSFATVLWTYNREQMNPLLCTPLTSALIFKDITMLYQTLMVASFLTWSWKLALKKTLYGKIVATKGRCNSISTLMSFSLFQ